MQNFQDIEHFVKTLSAAIKKKIPTKVSQLTNDVGYKTTDTNTTYKLSKSGSTVTLTGSDGSTTSVTDSNTTYSSLKNPYSLTIQNNGTTVASYDGSTAKTANFTNATASANGLMSKSDKAKLDGIGAGSNVKSVNGKTGAVSLSKADVGLGNVDNTRDADKPYYKLIGNYNTHSNDVGNCKWNEAKNSLYKIKNFYAISGEGDYFYLAHKKHEYTITATKQFSQVNNMFTSDLSSDCFIRTDLCSEADPAILTIIRDYAITATDVVTLLFIQHTGGSDASQFNHWKLEILADRDSSKDWPNATVTWKADDWITVFERTNVSDVPNALYCCLNPYNKNGVSYIYIKGIRLTIYAATPRNQNPGAFGYNSVPIGRLCLLDSRPSFSPAEALGALDVAGGTVYGKTTFQEGISATSYSGASATSSADGLMSKSDKAKLDGIGAGSNVKSVNGKTGAVTLAKGDVGLGSVANYDQSKAIKSITRSGTTFTATALDGTTTTFTQQDNNTTYGVATSSADGLMSKSDKAKLDGIGTGSNVKSVNGKTGAVTLAKGDVGLGNVANLDQSKAIKSITRSGTTFTATALDGTTTTFTQQDNNTTYGLASQSSNGLMSAADKKAVDREFFRMLPKGGTVIPNGANLNSTAYLKVGNYYQSAIVNTTNMTNIPIKSAFMMYVLSPLSENYDNESTTQWVYRLRIFVEYTGNNIFVQTVSSGATAGNFSYGPWVKMTNSTDLAAVSKIINDHIANKANPHGVTKAQVGLGNVDNTADSAKSVKYAASAGSANSVAWGNVSGRPSSLPANGGNSSTVNGHTVNADVPAGAKFTDTTYGIATSSADGLMSKSDKAKLDGISSGADAVTIKTVKVNGTALTPDSNKAVNVTVPKLANNATTTTSGMALDARMGKTLSDQIASVKTGAIDQIVNLTAAGWTGDAAPYSQTVNVTGMTDELLCELFSACPKTATVAEREAYNEAFALVASGYAETADGSATFLVDEKPAIDIGVRIKSISKANAVSAQTSSDITSAVDAMSNTLEGRVNALNLSLANNVPTNSAWAHGRLDGTTVNLMFSHNVESITTSDGYTFYVKFSNPFPDEYYAAVGSFDIGGMGQEIVGVYGYGTAGFSIDVQNASGNAPTPSIISVIALR